MRNHPNINRFLTTKLGHLKPDVGVSTWLSSVTSNPEGILYPKILPVTVQRRIFNELSVSATISSKPTSNLTSVYCNTVPIKSQLKSSSLRTSFYLTLPSTSSLLCVIVTQPGLKVNATNNEGDRWSPVLKIARGTYLLIIPTTYGCFITINRIIPEADAASRMCGIQGKALREWFSFRHIRYLVFFRHF